VAITTRFTDMFGCRVPIQQAGIGGFSSPSLALAVAEAGGVGMLTGTVGHMALSAHLDVVGPGRPIGVNFLVPFLDPAGLEIAAERSPLVEFFWGWPTADLVEVVHAGGARAGWQVGSADEARAARDAGCDLVIAQGIEAGGHVRGSLPLLALLDQVRPLIDDLPLLAAGGIGTGRDMANAMIAGADGVRVGTRFMASVESVAHPRYVAALIAAEPEDTVITTAFGDGWPDAPHRVLRSALTAGEALGAAQSWSPNWPDSTAAGAIEAHALYAGQSVGAVRSREPAAEIMSALVMDAEPLLSKINP
jgi:NAD(P)H-dependent flavin oxidoreductase YrpB (nitropropane dioxygenase family)